jgi:hypothetical protein
MGNYEATDAYLDKLAAMVAAGGLQLDGVTISAQAAGLGGDQWIFDETHGGLTELYANQLLDDSQAIVVAGIDVEDVIYQSSKTGPSIVQADNVTFYRNWGYYAFGQNWPVTNPKFGGHSGWFLVASIESFSGIYGHATHGDPVDAFAAEAFGGTDYSNTPVGWIGHTAEPGLGGIHTKHLGERWAQGYTFAEAAWIGRNTRQCLAVGWPWATR